MAVVTAYRLAGFMFFPTHVSKEGDVEGEAGVGRRERGREGGTNGEGEVRRQGGMGEGMDGGWSMGGNVSPGCGRACQLAGGS